MPKKSLDEIFAAAPETGVRQAVALEPEEPESFDLGRTIANVPGSAARLAGDIFNAVADPIETAKAVGKTALGAAEKLVPGRQKSEEQFDNVLHFFQERYGSKDAILKTIQDDPVGFVADVSGLLTGGGAVLKGTAAVSRSSRLARAGAAASAAGRITEPVAAIAKATEVATRPVRRITTALGREALGVSTGTSGDVIRSAFQASKRSSPEFTKALRGVTTQEDVLTAAREALYELKDNRATAYRSQFSKIEKSVRKLDASSVKSVVATQLEKFKIGKRGKRLDFSRSPIADASEQKRIASVLREVEGWKDLTPAGLDTLKQRLDDFYTPSPRGANLITNIRNGVKKVLTDNVKGYEEMVRQYSETTELIDDINKTLSLSGSKDTAIGKLTRVLKQDRQFRQSLVKRLDELTPKDLEAQIAGVSLAPGVPGGLIGRSLFAGSLFGGAISNPGFLMGLAGTSPRVVGEFLNALGLTAKTAESVIDRLDKMGFFSKPARTGAFQAGRVEGDVEDTDEVPEGAPTLAEIFLSQ